MKAVLVTGGAGYIGSHTCKMLANSGYIPVTYDNLSTGHKKAVKWGPLVVGNLHDTTLLKNTMDEYKPVAVIHFAASAYVGESVSHPMKYYQNNVGGTLSLLEAMQSAKVFNFVFSSTCATYGSPDLRVIDENCAQEPINPYGKSKLMIETILRDLAGQGLLNQISLRYFNAAGADKNGEIGEQHYPETHLVPLAIASAFGGLELKIFGTDFPTPDGTAVRDYIHVEDLARAHILAVEHLISAASIYKNNPNLASEPLISDFINLGTGSGHSVKEIINALKELGLNVRAAEANRRDGDPAYLVASTAKAQAILGWNPEYTNIGQLLTTAINWQKIQDNYDINPQN